MSRAGWLWPNLHTLHDLHLGGGDCCSPWCSPAWPCRKRWRPHLPARTAGAVELRNLLAEQFQLDLPATFSFDHPSLAAMAAYLAGRLPSPTQAGPASSSGTDASPLFAGSSAGPGRQLWEGPAQPDMPSATELVAVSGRYPEPSLAGDAEGGCSPGGAAGFWAGMRQSANLQSVLPLSRWDMDALFAPELGGSPAAHSRGSMYTRFAAVCRDVDAFDAAAFRLAAAEAAAVDPQVR